jgi:epsin
MKCPSNNNCLSPLSPSRNDFIEMMEIMDKRLNDKGKNWRHVFKTLTLLDYLLRSGSENVVIYFRDNMYVVKTLREFQFIDDSGKDQGANGKSQQAE